MIYQKVSADMKFVDREKEVEKFWKDNDIFQKSIDNRKEGPTYTFYDGPPTANGKPHIGHVLTRVIKDMIPRYRTMKGYMVPRKAGWDTHGLPVELEVEKMLGLDGKEQIEEYGLEPFIKHCKESVWKYKGMWEDFSSTVGFWADMDNPYVTYDNNFIESEWWALKQIWDKGLLYKGFKIVPYCPRCGTPLSSHEVAQGYKTLKERTAVVRFKIVGEDAYFLAHSALILLFVLIQMRLMQELRQQMDSHTSWQRHFLTRFLVGLREKKAHLLMRLLKNTRVKTLNIRNMSHFTSVQRMLLTSSTRKHFSYTAIIM